MYRGENAEDWCRDDPENISDLVVKSHVLERLHGEVSGKTVLDVGC